jgi:hypothetical protein
MIRLLAILALAASQAFAADDPQKTIDALQAALQQSQAQTAQANQIQLQMAVEIAALRKEIEALKKKDAPPK